MYYPTLAYNELPPLPPKGEIETRAVLKLCIEARASLASLRQAGELIPNQAMLINSLPLLEAKDSSELENIVTTTDKLFKHAFNDTVADHATKEALRYRTALYEGVEAIRDRPLTAQTALDVCSAIKGVQMQIRHSKGTVLQNSLGQVIYTPPDDKGAILALLDNWERFLHANDDLDPLVKMAIAHYQFEAIHPFSDGNGRAGRVINILYLLDKGLLATPILYLSRYILRNKQGYYDGLLGVTEQGDWQSFIVYMLQAVKQTSEWTTAKILNIKELHSDTIEQAKQLAPKVYSRELVDAIFAMPYCRITNLVDEGLGTRQTVSGYLKKLVEIGILEEMQAGKEKLFINPRLMVVLQGDGSHN